jgi:hypothetical protein
MTTCSKCGQTRPRERRRTMKRRICPFCCGFGLVPTYDKDPRRVSNAGPAWPAGRPCTCVEGTRAKRQLAEKGGGR